MTHMIRGRFVNDMEEIVFSDNIIMEVFGKETGMDISYDNSVMSNRVLAISDESDGSSLYVGTGRLTYDLDYFVIDNVCVLKGHRFRGYGDFMIRILTDKAIQCGADAIYSYCPDASAPVFEKIGFKKCEISDDSDASDISNISVSVPPYYGISFPAGQTSLYKLTPADFCTKCKSMPAG